MADKKASFIIELKDFMSGGLGKLSASLAVLRQGWLAVSDIANKAISIFAGVLNSFAAQEAAINKVNIALKNQGIVSRDVTRDYIDFASQIQKTTTYADEQILEMSALLATFGIVGDEMKTTIQLSADLASGLGIDLRTATMMMGKAFLGETGTLSRYGIVVSDTIPKAERFAQLQRQIGERFGGAAASEADTYAGKLAQMKNTFDDLKEVVGAFIAGPAQFWAEWLRDGIEKINQHIAATERQATGDMNRYQKIKAGLEESIRKEKEFLDIAKKNSSGPGDAMYDAAAKRYADYVRAKIQLEKDFAKELSAGTTTKPVSKPPADLDAAKKAEDEKQALISKAQTEIDNATYTREELDSIETDKMAKELEKKGQHQMALNLLDAKRTEAEKKEAQTRAKNLSTTLNNIASLSTSHNKTLAAVGKAAAISTATIDTYAAANVAMKSAPPPWNYALAAMVVAAGLANVARISGVKLAEGGMIMPRAGGVMATMGEAGSAEVAIPLDDERTKEKLRDTLGGGGLTVVINAGTIVADDYSVGQFAQKIDEKLFQLQRNGRTYL